MTETVPRSCRALLMLAVAFSGCAPSPTGMTDVGGAPTTSDETSTTGASPQTSGQQDSGDSTTGGSSTTTADDGGDAVMCDPGAQDCPEGSKCTAYRMAVVGCCTDANKCVPVIGNGQVGDSCWREDDNDDCAAGLYCDVPGGKFMGEGICRILCDVDDPAACPGDGLCIGYNQGSLPLCVTPCDPLSPTACNEGEGCYLAGEDQFHCLWPGPPADGGLDGMQCVGINECVPGLTCVFREMKPSCSTSRCCTPFCDVSEPEVCTAADETCVPVFDEDEAPPGLEHVGLCGVPV